MKAELTKATLTAIKKIYDADINEASIQLQNTRKEFTGDYTIVVFPFLRYSKKSPELTAKEIGEYLKSEITYIENFNVIKGFLNIELHSKHWVKQFYSAYEDKQFGIKKATDNSPVILVEYSSPNTNKPLHLGHVRNNVLGYSISKILTANGNQVVKTNIVNDRGIHICKSMLAWQKWGNNETPKSSGMKGDFLVGKYYVKFDTEYKAELTQLISSGKSKEEAENESRLMQEAREMLQKWEANDQEVVKLWKTMNNWVYEGFDVTYKNLGVNFDKIYYESDTYKLGKKIVLEALANKILEQQEDGSIWANLEAEGLDKKILLRADGTSVYMTQDIGTACIRYDDFKFDKHIYVVGNEQDYHFKVLKKILNKLNYKWADNILHLSYGMVELPEGKMKSREGTVVDADDLIAEMRKTASDISSELGKLDNLSVSEQNKTINMIALGALKYFLLKVDPKKNMVFNPKESIDFNGNTASSIQYTHARIQSLKIKADKQNIDYSNHIADIKLHNEEQNLIKTITRFPEVVSEAEKQLNPAVIANYTYDLAKEYNQFYHDFSVLNETDVKVVKFRLQISILTGKVIKNAMNLLGIDVPDRM